MSADLTAPQAKAPRGISWLEKWLPALIFVGVFVVWAMFTFWAPRVEQDVATRGQFGDSYGFLNALFSALAFGAVSYAIILQRHQLEVQQTELTLTRDEFIKSRTAQVLFQSMEIFRAVQPKWRALPEFPNDFREWTPEQRALAHDLSDGLQQVAFFCEEELIDRELIMRRNALVFVRSWRFLCSFIQAYRVATGEPRTAAEGAFHRRHFEEFALRCEAFLYREHPGIPLDLIKTSTISPGAPASGPDRVG